MNQSNAARSDEGEESQGAGRRPVDHVRVGNVEIAIWRNKGTGGEFYSASAPTIRYKEKEGEDWKNGSSFGVTDLLCMAEAARETSSRMRELARGRGR